MNDKLLQSWWVYALRGIAAIAFGVLAVTWPGLTLFWLVALFAAYALIQGAVSAYGALRNRKSDDDWWLNLLLGIVSIGAALIAVFHPALTALVLVLVMAANALIVGVLDIAVAIRLRKAIQNEWLLILAGVASIVFGVLVFLFPGAGAVVMVAMIAAWAIFTGVVFLALAFRARAWARDHKPARAEPHPDEHRGHPA
jgi:uncharacterized membrane protein HdeD (DUF308 family)